MENVSLCCSAKDNSLQSSKAMKSCLCLCTISISLLEFFDHLYMIHLTILISLVGTVVKIVVFPHNKVQTNHTKLVAYSHEVLHRLCTDSIGDYVRTKSCNFCHTITSARADFFPSSQGESSSILAVLSPRLPPFACMACDIITATKTHSIFSFPHPLCGSLLCQCLGQAKSSSLYASNGSSLLVSSGSGQVGCF